MNKQERMYQKIRKHGEDLKDIFDLYGTDGVKLCKKLRRLERQANAAMIAHCNGDCTTEDIDDFCDNTLLPRLRKILGHGEYLAKVYINRDPRGYTLKLTEDATREAQESGCNIYRDFGGYGILAPDFSE